MLILMAATRVAPSIDSLQAKYTRLPNNKNHRHSPWFYKTPESRLLLTARKRVRKFPHSPLYTKNYGSCTYTSN